MKDDLFNFDESLADGFNKKPTNDNEAKLKKARVLCIRGRFEQALAICEEILDEDMENMGAYVEILRVHSEDFTIFEGKEIDQDIHAIERLFPDIDNDEYIDYLQRRRKFLNSNSKNKNDDNSSEIKSEKKNNNDTNVNSSNNQNTSSNGDPFTILADYLENKPNNALSQVVKTEKKTTSSANKTKTRKKYSESEALDIIRNQASHTKQNVENAKADYDEYAQNGSASALCNIGYFYASGAHGYTVDEKKAFEYTKKAADLNDVTGTFNLGIYYANGTGITKNLKKAFEFYKKAADLGDVDAIYQTGECYYKGNGITKNIKKALEYLNKAHEKGNAQATYLIGLIHCDSKNENADLKKGLEYLKKAIDAGVKEAEKPYEEYKEIYDITQDIFSTYKYGLSDSDANEIIVNQSKYSASKIKDAKKAYEEYANEGNSVVLCDLGYFHETGKYGYEKDLNKAFAYYSKSAELGHKIGLYDLGLCYQYGKGCRKNLTKAKECFKKSADLGYADAEKQLKELTTISEKDAKDIIQNQAKYTLSKINEAKKAYEKYANEGSASALCNIGYWHETGKYGYTQDINKAFAFYLKSADAGNITGMYNLGLCYQYGRGCTKNLTKAKEYLKKSADLGDADAQKQLLTLSRMTETEAREIIQNQSKYTLAKVNEAKKTYEEYASEGSCTALCNIGFWHDSGKYGYAKDMSKAKVYYEKSAIAGSTQGMYNLAYCYKYGEFGYVDFDKAFDWYKKAADLGHADAKTAIAKFPAIKESTAKDIIVNSSKYSATKVQEAKTAYQAYADLGSSAALCNIGLYYSLGKYGYIQDRKKAFEYYKKSADKGSKNAMFNLGIYYRYGYAVAKDLAKSFEYYKKSADLGDVEAMYETGRCYRDGSGVLKNTAKAIEYFKKASVNGNKDAKDALKKMGY